MRERIMQQALFGVVAILAFGSSASGQTVYPIDRAEILAGARFDVKVEFAGPVKPDDVKITLNGADAAAVFGKPVQFVEKEDGKDQSALILRDVTLDKPGSYKVAVTSPEATRDITWTVFDTGPRKARNVVLLIGDGLSPRTGSRRG